MVQQPRDAGMASSFLLRQAALCEGVCSSHRDFSPDLGVFCDQFNPTGFTDASVQFSDAAGNIAKRPVYTIDRVPNRGIDSHPSGTFACFSAQNILPPREQREPSRSQRPPLANWHMISHCPFVPTYAPTVALPRARRGVVAGCANACAAAWCTPCAFLRACALPPRSSDTTHLVCAWLNSAALLRSHLASFWGSVRSRPRLASSHGR
jgi:hypothetical protein